jgi:hypothetical protein
VIFAADAGINEVLEKPVTKKKVQNILKRFCRSGN